VLGCGGVGGGVGRSSSLWFGGGVGGGVWARVCAAATAALPSSDGEASSVMLRPAQGADGGAPRRCT